MFLVHLATIPITGTGINPARNLGAAIIYNKDHAWDDHAIGPFIGAALAAIYHQIIIRTCPFKTIRGVELPRLWMYKILFRGVEVIVCFPIFLVQFPLDFEWQEDM
ncbi:hypothetical protein Gotur_030054 [Gossypium turneri]